MYPQGSATRHPDMPIEASVADRLVNARARLNDAISRIMNTADALCGNMPREVGPAVDKQAPPSGFIDLVGMSAVDIDRQADLLIAQVERIHSRLGTA